MKFFIIAGEASGDLHASSLVTSISDIMPEAQFTGIGGERMRESGVKTLLDISEVNFIGFTSVLMNIFTIKRILKTTVQAILNDKPDALILVDFPGFNLRIAEKIRKDFKGKIIYYISPQVWAWHKNRIEIMKRTIDELIVVFPFEVEFFEKEGMKAHYSGHPLVKRIDDFKRRNASAKPDKIRITFLPGSRKGEVESMLPILAEAGRMLKAKYDCELCIVCAPHIESSAYDKVRSSGIFTLIERNGESDANYRAILNSNAVITKSGTSTLECGLIGTPFVVVYRTGPLNYAIGKRLVRVKFISMVNILLDKHAVMELLQEQMTPKAIFDEVCKILDDKEYSKNMKNDFEQLHDILGNDDASAVAADRICKLLK